MPERQIWIITGPAGSGKSTVARYLAERLSLPYIEGDDFHPPANIAKMSAGVPLTDADRWGWLAVLRAAALRAGARGAVLTCSALRRSYRDVIRGDGGDGVRFVYLRAPEAVLLQRVRARRGHYMKDDMVRSQLCSLEEPGPDEADCVCVDVSAPAELVNRAALDAVTRALRGA